MTARDFDYRSTRTLDDRTDIELRSTCTLDDRARHRPSIAAHTRRPHATSTIDRPARSMTAPTSNFDRRAHPMTARDIDHRSPRTLDDRTRHRSSIDAPVLCEQLGSARCWHLER